jgi:hypothetical protein
MCCMYRTAAHIEPLHISNRCLYRTVLYIELLHISNCCIYRTVVYIEPLYVSNRCIYRTVAYIETLHISNRFIYRTAAYIETLRKHYFNCCEDSLTMAPMECRNMWEEVLCICCIYIPVHAKLVSYLDITVTLSSYFLVVYP